MIIVHGRIEVAPTDRAAFAQIASEVVEPSRSEAGCSAYEIGTSVADDCVFYILEEWNSQENLDQHVTEPHYKTFARAMRGLEVRSMTIHTFEAPDKRKLV